MKNKQNETQAGESRTPLRPWWISWYHTQGMGAFTLETPWWVTGEGNGFTTICAAVRAESEEAAKEVILAAFDTRPAKIEWRFCSERHANWSPFSDCFPKADWNVW